MEVNNLADLGEKFLKNHADKLIYAKFFKWWDELVGPVIAPISNPIFYKNQAMIVEVKDYQWLNELRYHIPDIIKKYQQKTRINGLKKSINTIELKYNPHLKKPKKNLNKILTTKHHKSQILATATEATKANVNKKLTTLLVQLKRYAAGKDLHNVSNSLPLSADLLEKSYNKHKNNSILSMYSIEQLFPRSSFYSEFLNPPDELQQFDLF